MSPRRGPRQAERLVSPMQRHHERIVLLRHLLDAELRDYRQCAEAGYVQSKRGDGAGGRSSDVSDPTGELAANDQRTAAQKEAAASAMRTADRHVDDAIRSMQKALRQLSRPFVKKRDWTSMKGVTGDVFATVTAAEIEESRRMAEARLKRGEE